MSAGRELEAAAGLAGPALGQLNLMLARKKISRSTCAWAAGEFEEAASRLRQMAGVSKDDAGDSGTTD